VGRKSPKLKSHSNKIVKSTVSKMKSCYFGRSRTCCPDVCVWDLGRNLISWGLTCSRADRLTESIYGFEPSKMKFTTISTTDTILALPVIDLRLLTNFGLLTSNLDASRRQTSDGQRACGIVPRSSSLLPPMPACRALSLYGFWSQPIQPLAL